MKDKRRLNPDHIDAALQGSEVAPGLESVSSWAAAVRRQTATEISIDAAAAQISAAAQTAADANPGGAGYSALKPSRLERIRRRLVFGSLLSGIGAKVFAASVALATATGGVAATGSLPDAVQDPIATVYNSVGFDFPTSHDDGCDHDAPDCDNDENADDREEAPGGGSDDDSSAVKNDEEPDDGDDDSNDDSDDDSDDLDDDEQGDDDDQGDDDQGDDDDQGNDNDEKKDDDDKPGKGLGRDKDKENPGGGDDDDDQGDDEDADDEDQDDGQGDDDDGQDDQGGGDEE